MRPRSNDRGNVDVVGGGAGITGASMRPRSNDRGNARAKHFSLCEGFASMRPRSNDRGNAEKVAQYLERPGLLQ